MQKDAGTVIDERSKKKIKSYANKIKNAIEEGVITEEDGKLIHGLIAEVTANKNITDTRKLIIASVLVGFRKFLPPFLECETIDIQNAVNEFLETTELAKDTQRSWIGVLKQFLNWMMEDGLNLKLNVTKIARIKPKIELKQLTPNDILTYSELRSLNNAARNTRDRAFLEVLYDSGGRVSEVCTLKISQITFDGKKTLVTIKSKTKHIKECPLLTSGVALKNWLEQHPCKTDPNASVFPGLRSNPYKPLSQSSARRIVRDAAKDAGIMKRVHPHLFRHTRITHMMVEGYSEQDIKMAMWGHVGTDMLKTYTHMTRTDASNSIYRHAGLEDINGNVTQQTKPLTICQDCKEVNPSDRRFCGDCGFPLHIKKFPLYIKNVDQTNKDDDKIDKVAEFVKTLPQYWEIDEICRTNPDIKDAYLAIRDNVRD